MQNLSVVSGGAELSFVLIAVSLELINPLKNPIVYNKQFILKRLSLYIDVIALFSKRR